MSFFKKKKSVCKNNPSASPCCLLFPIESQIHSAGKTVAYLGAKFVT